MPKPASPPTKYDMLLECRNCGELEGQLATLKEEKAKQDQHIQEQDQRIQELAAEVKRLDVGTALVTTVKLDLSVAHPYQKDLSKAKCLVCLSKLFVVKGRFANKRENRDMQFCSGYHWLWRRKCPKEPHMHRYCTICKAEWFEARTLGLEVP